MRNKQPVSIKELAVGLTGSNDAPIWILIAWLSGGLITETAGDYLSNYLILGIPAGWAISLLLVLLLLGFYFISRYYFMRRRKFTIVMEQKPPVGKHGLILLISPINPRRGVARDELEQSLQYLAHTEVGNLTPDDFDVLDNSNLEPPLRAIEFHYQAGKLRDCWLIGTLETDGEKGSKDVRPLLAKWFMVLHPGHSINFHNDDNLCVNPRDYVSLWNQVDSIFMEAPYKPEHVIADVTSGTKLMSVGVALACIQDKRTMQYMDRGRDWRGEPVRDQEIVPILVDIDPYLNVV
jgi:hypothetical protein